MGIFNVKKEESYLQLLKNSRSCNWPCPFETGVFATTSLFLLPGNSFSHPLTLSLCVTSSGKPFLTPTMVPPQVGTPLCTLMLHSSFSKHTCHGVNETAFCIVMCLKSVPPLRIMDSDQEITMLSSAANIYPCFM